MVVRQTEVSYTVLQIAGFPSDRSDVSDRSAHNP